MPSPPYSYPSGLSLSLDSIRKELTKTEENTTRAYELSRELKGVLLRSKTDAEPLKEFEKLMAENSELLKADRVPRLANLSSCLEEYVRLRAFHHFLGSADLMVERPPIVTDEEFLGGACMGLAQELQRYGLGRATARDVESVHSAKVVVERILDYLLAFDFRNGPLRRKYDGTKYSLKALETLLYELSVTGEESPSGKRLKQSVPEELEALKKRFEHRDELRETLIKQCRDDMKLSKQAIYALHRGDADKAKNVLDRCREDIKIKLLPIVEEEPPLLHGSMNNVLEEYVEAQLFYTWLDGDLNKPKRSILEPHELDIPLKLVTPGVYLGGLCDLTGEIGRYAVHCGTVRNVEGVKECLQSISGIHIAMQSFRLPQGISKKMDQLRRSVEKIERMLYEMSLSDAAGGRKVETAMEEGPPEE